MPSIEKIFALFQVECFMIYNLKKIFGTNFVEPRQAWKKEMELWVMATNIMLLFFLTLKGKTEEAALEDLEFNKSE